MAISRRTLLSGLVALCASTSMLGGAASAQAAIAITAPTHDGYTNDRSPDVTFTGAVPNDPVTLEVDAVIIGNVIAGSDGSGTVTPDEDITTDPIDQDEDGNPLGTRYGLTVRDAEGLDTVTVHIDQAPSISGTGEDTTSAAADVYFDASSAIPGRDVILFIDGAEDKTVMANVDGSYFGVDHHIVPTASLLTAGPHAAYLKSVDAAGVRSSPGETVHFNVAPAAPTYSQLFDGIRLNRAETPVTLGDVDPTASEVTLYHVVSVNGIGTEVEVGHTDVVTNGTAIITPTLADGLHSLVAKQTVSGVETVSYNGDNGPISVFVDTSAPVLETSFPGTLTNDNTPYFDASGTLTNNGGNHTFARLYIDGALVGHSDPAFGGGTSSAQADNPIADGAHSAYMVTVDDLGHESVTHSNTVAFTVDTVGPGAPNVTSPVNGSTTSTSLPVLTVTAEPGSFVTVYVDGDGEEAHQTADSSGNVTFTLTQALADGQHVLYVWSRDAAGNTGDQTTTAFTVLTPAPPTPPTPPTVPTTPVATPTPTPVNPADPDSDGITNNWTVGGKAAPAPATPKVNVTDGKVKLQLAAAPKGAKSVRVYRADGKGGFKLVKTLTPGSKSFTDTKVKAGHTYKYKTVGVNAKGQQSKASGTATAKVKKK